VNAADTERLEKRASSLAEPGELALALRQAIQLRKDGGPLA
jgi:hypothetical protein